MKRVEILTVSPEMARAWLGKMRTNRHLRLTIVGVYLAAMRAGRWHLQGDPIRFDEDGFLIDGQHRLQALVEYGKPLEFVVMRDVDKDAMKSIDTGARRSPADILAIHGSEHASLRAACLGMLMGYRISNGKSLTPVMTISVNGNRINRQISAEELLMEPRHWPGLDDSFQWARKASRTLKMGAAIFSVLHYLFARVSESEADEFMSGLIDGVGLKKGSVVHALRTQMLTGALRGRRPTKKEIALRCVRAWNAYRTDPNSPRQTIKVLRHESGLIKGDLPEIK